MFEQIIEASQGKQIVMFLDYDGTLSPIVEDPDRAFMSDSVSTPILSSVHYNFLAVSKFLCLNFYHVNIQMRKTVKRLARCFPTAIVSGRCRDKVHLFSSCLHSLFFYIIFVIFMLEVMVNCCINWAVGLQICTIGRALLCW